MYRHFARFRNFGKLLTLLFVFSLVAGRANANPGSAFSYQGRLTNNGSPVIGTVSLRFTLYDDLSAGIQRGSEIVVDPVFPDSNGLVFQTLDFGADQFNGDARFLQIEVDLDGGSDAFVALTPRTELLPTPYSMRATSADFSDVATGLDDGVGGSISASALGDAHSLDAEGGALTDVVFVEADGTVRVSGLTLFALVTRGTASLISDPIDLLLLEGTKLVPIYGDPLRAEFYDVTDPDNPVSSGSYDSGIDPSRADAGDLKSGMMFIANYSDDVIYSFDASDPGAVVALDSFTSGTLFPSDLVANDAGTFFYYLDYGSESLTVYDATNPADIQERGNISTFDDPIWMDVVGTTVFLFDNQGFISVDVSDPDNPTILDIMPDVGVFEISGSYAYAFDFFSPEIQVINISDPANLVLENTVSIPGSLAVVQPEISGDFLFVRDFFDGGVYVWYLGTPANPSYVGFSAIDTDVLESGWETNNGFVYAVDDFNEELTILQFAFAPSYSTVLEIRNSTLTYTGTVNVDGSVQSQEAAFVSLEVFAGDFILLDAAQVDAGFLFGDGSGITNISTLGTPDGSVPDVVAIDNKGDVGINTSDPLGFQLAVNGSTANLSGTWSVFSDERLKENVETIHGPLDAILNLRPVTFEYNETGRALWGGREDEGRKHYGFVAQEFGRVFPDAVSVNEKTGYETLTPDALQPNLVGAVQELNEKLKQKDAQIDELKARLEKLEALLTKENSAAK